MHPLSISSQPALSATGDEDALVDCKASKACISMPEDTTAVAHGDTNLALEDFMKAAIPNYR